MMQLFVDFFIVSNKKKNPIAISKCFFHFLKLFISLIKINPKIVTTPN